VEYGLEAVVRKKIKVVEGEGRNEVVTMEKEPLEKSKNV
jgi:hypothetical protein